METAEGKLKTKLTQLNRTTKRTTSILDSAQSEAIERHQKTLKTVINDVDQLRIEIEAYKITNEVTDEELDAWNTNIASQIAEADQSVESLKGWLNNRKTEREIHEREEQIKFEVKLQETKAKFKDELVGKQASSLQSQSEAVNIQAKLPKLVITKFNGTFTDWNRFWGQFTESIDKSSLPAITKFSYLRELLDDKVKKAVLGLPYTSEGYNRTVAILKEQYGKEREIVKAYVKEILELPPVLTANPRKIHEFWEKLTYNVQSLQTMNKLSQVDGAVAMTLDKLPAVRGDLVRTDPDWERWNFAQLTEALRLWTRRNPITESATSEDKDRKRERVGRNYNTHQGKGALRPCVYCDAADHKSTICPTVKTSDERRKILAKKKLCFNCTGPSHRAAECKSTVTCHNCARRHHTSICENPKKPEGFMSAHREEDNQVIYPVVVVEVDGIKTRALLDTGSGSCYASSKLIDALDKKPKEIQTKRIEMMLGSTTTSVEIYPATVKSIDGQFTMEVELSKVHKPQLMEIDNPRYEELLSKYNHLKGVKVDDLDDKPQLPVHVVLGVNEYANIKTTTAPRVGKSGQPIAERTRLGWVFMSPGREDVTSPLLLTRSVATDYEQLCSLDVLGLADKPENDQETVYQEFKEQLQRNEAGWYESKLPWKANHPALPTNEAGSRRRLQQLVKRLERDGNYERYDSIIQEQLQSGVIESAPTKPTGNEYYMPHKGVVKEDAESTKLRVVYDASAREDAKQPSLNDCLNPGPSLQNLLWNVLIRSRFHPILLTGDLQKAFLQIRIKEEERDSLRFHWRAPGSTETEIYRFTRALFGLTSSPFLLAGVINHHLELWERRYPKIVKEIRDGLYVVDLMAGGTTIEVVQTKKAAAVEVFEDASFTLHKWHSNARELEASSNPPADDELTYAKQQLGASRSETKLFGLSWDKDKDTLKVGLHEGETISTKRNALSQLAKIYDPLGLTSPSTLEGKVLFREMCEINVAWDHELPADLKRRWMGWYSRLPNYIEVKRTLAPHRQPILEIVLHAFGDASTRGVCAAVYAVVRQADGTTQGLVCAKSRLAKRNLTIPRLELVAGHMAVNLVDNVQLAIDLCPVSVHCWLDSTVALYWIKGHGEYRQFVSNRVHKIQEHENVKWHHVPTSENPADLGSRGGSVEHHQLWNQGPSWLSDEEKWPPDIILEPNADSNAEVKVTRSILATTTQVCDDFDKLLDAHDVHKVLRIGAWIQRFIRNCRTPARDRQVGPLDATEIDRQRLWWTKRAQQECQGSTCFKEDQVRLNLQLNSQDILECRGRIEGEFPIYLPDRHPFTHGIVRQAHLSTLHGGVSLTMAKTREVYWIPRLRRLVKKVSRTCWGCKRFRAQAYKSPPPGNLPSTRTQGSAPFEVIGVDFAGPIYYQSKPGTESKAYLALYGCSLTRAVYLDLLKSLEAPEFITSLKQFIARRGRPKLIYSDNGSTFKATEKWLRQVQKDERLNDYLANLSIKWQFNLSRAPWWGGQFERLIGLFKNAFHKTVGNRTLRWTELEEVVIDVEVSLNNRPLSYVEDDLQLPLLTPNSMLTINPNHLPELKAHHEEADLRKRAKYIKKCKEAVWNRWTREYIRSLREQHRRAGGEQTAHPNVGDVVIIKGERKNRNTWKLGIVTELIKGRDGITRAAKLRVGSGNLERALQHLCPLELSCDWRQPSQLDATAPTFQPRRRRDAAAAAEVRIRQTAEEEGKDY